MADDRPPKRRSNDQASKGGPRRPGEGGRSGGRGGSGGGRPPKGRDGGSRSGGPPRGKGGGRPGADREREEGRTAGPKQWGSLGRKGAGRLTAENFDARGGVGGQGRDERPAPDRRQDEWVRVDDVRDEAAGAVRRGRSPGGRRNGDRPAPKERRGRQDRGAGPGTGGAEARDELVAALGASRGDRANARLREAARAFERERFGEARTILRPIAEQAPGAASVRELLGLTCYRLGRWRDAVSELEAFRTLTDSCEQHPVLADAYRAQGKHRQVEELWDELRAASPAPDLVVEGRIVMAGSLADRGELGAAIALMEKAPKAPRSPQVHHLRAGYVLADLYERAGDAARARELFRWVVDHEPDFADAPERLHALG